MRVFGKRRPFRAWVGFGRAHALNSLGRPAKAIGLLNEIRSLDYTRIGWSEALERIDFEWARAEWALGRRAGMLEKMQASVDAMATKDT